jgi:hypothetical protein
VHVDVASHAPHGRKHGTTFAETWTLADKTVVVAIGAVLAGNDAFVVCDLVRTGAHAVVTSRKALAGAVSTLDRIVRNHAREHRDDALAAAIMLIGIPPAGNDVEAAGAGRLYGGLIDGNGATHALHAHAAALGAGAQLAETTPVHLRRDDVVAIATAPIPPGWWDAGDRTATALLHRAAAPDAAAAIVTPP